MSRQAQTVTKSLVSLGGRAVSANQIKHSYRAISKDGWESICSCKGWMLCCVHLFLYCSFCLSSSISSHGHPLLFTFLNFRVVYCVTFCHAEVALDFIWLPRCTQYHRLSMFWRKNCIVMWRSRFHGCFQISVWQMSSPKAGSTEISDYLVLVASYWSKNRQRFFGAPYDIVAWQRSTANFYPCPLPALSSTWAIYNCTISKGDDCVSDIAKKKRKHVQQFGQWHRY